MRENLNTSRAIRMPEPSGNDLMMSPRVLSPRISGVPSQMHRSSNGSSLPIHGCAPTARTRRRRKRLASRRWTFPGTARDDPFAHRELARPFRGQFLRKFRTRNLELGTWNLELGTWNPELGTWNLELGTLLLSQAIQVFHRTKYDCSFDERGRCIGAFAELIRCDDVVAFGVRTKNGNRPILRGRVEVTAS
jgi:hypothetical protein